MPKSTIFFLFFLSFSVLLHNIVTASDDIRCLQGLKDSFKDPNRNLNSWNFLNYSMGFICRFIGVTCWNNLENRVISLSLPNMDLSGQLPDAFKYCSSMTTLDLSGNRFSGPIPSKICSWIPYLVVLDLSNNSFYGAIPAELGNCTYRHFQDCLTMNLEGTDISAAEHYPNVVEDEKTDISEFCSPRLNVSKFLFPTLSS